MLDAAASGNRSHAPPRPLDLARHDRSPGLRFLGLLGHMGPLIAAIAMGASDITVIGNALWLKRRLDRVLGHCS